MAAISKTWRKPKCYHNGFILLAEQAIDDRNVNELVAEGKVLLRNPEGSVMRGDRVRLPDDYRASPRFIDVSAMGHEAKNST